MPYGQQAAVPRILQESEPKLYNQVPIASISVSGNLQQMTVNYILKTGGFCYFTNLTVVIVPWAQYYLSFRGEEWIVFLLTSWNWMALWKWWGKEKMKCLAVEERTVRTIDTCRMGLGLWNKHLGYASDKKSDRMKYATILMLKVWRLWLRPWPFCITRISHNFGKPATKGFPSPILLQPLMTNLLPDNRPIEGSCEVITLPFNSSPQQECRPPGCEADQGWEARCFGTLGGK